MDSSRGGSVDEQIGPNGPNVTQNPFDPAALLGKSHCVTPPDIPVGGLMFYHRFFFFLVLFRPLISELAERNSTKIGRMVSGVSAVWKRMPKIWGIPSPYKSGVQNPLFRWLRNSAAILTAYIFGTKHGIDNQASALQTIGVSYNVSKRHELWSTNGFKLDRSFYPPSVNSAFHFIAKLRRRRSANRTQPNFAKRWAVNRANNLPQKIGVVPPQKMGAKNLYTFGRFLDVFDT